MLPCVGGSEPTTLQRPPLRHPIVQIVACAPPFTLGLRRNYAVCRPQALDLAAWLSAHVRAGDHVSVVMDLEVRLCIEIDTRLNLIVWNKKVARMQCFQFCDIILACPLFI